VGSIESVIFSLRTLEKVKFYKARNLVEFEYSTPALRIVGAVALDLLMGESIRFDIFIYGIQIRAPITT
jgi:hypothetical protein